MKIWAHRGCSKRYPKNTLLAFEKAAGLQDSIVYSTFYAKLLVKLHPFWRGMDVYKKELEGNSVRAWMSGHLYPEKLTENKLDFKLWEEKGITDIILNEQEAYIK